MCGIPRLSHQPEYVRKPVFEPATIRRNNGQPSLPLFPSIPGIILQLPFSFPLVTHDARSDHQTIKYTEDLSRPSSTSLYDDFETGESFNYSYFWIISRILQLLFSFLLVTHERQIKSSDDKYTRICRVQVPHPLMMILKQVNLSTILIFGSFLESFRSLSSSSSSHTNARSNHQTIKYTRICRVQVPHPLIMILKR